VRGGTRSELVPDGQGWLWTSTHSNWFHIPGTVYKVNMTTNEMVAVTTFDADKGPRFGRGPGTLAYDGNGFMWGASLANHQRTKGSLFKIDVTTNKRSTVAESMDCGGPPGIQAMGDMVSDGKGSLWFAGVVDGGSRGAGNALVRVNASTREIAMRYRQAGYADIESPVIDENGLLWGTTAQSGASRNGSIYTFDPATQKFTTVMSFTGNGSQARSGSFPKVARLMKHSDGNFYGVTRYGGPGGNGTVYRLRFGPTPMTQEASLLADGRAELHGTITPNGRDTEVAFEWDTEATLAHPHLVPAGIVSAGGSRQPVSAVLGDLKPGTTYFFRVRGTNSANAIPQRGAVLRFTTPGPLAEASKHDEDSADKAPAAASDGFTNSTASTVASKHSLKVNRIPGAGAGFVRGAQSGAVYEIGHRYTLLAVADNGYVFDHWSGPGITGAQAESERLSFVFTEALAQSPTITATFVRTPFTEGVTGTFTGLVMPSKNAIPNVTNTGALRLTVSRTGTFTGSLRYDSDTLLLTGAFDTGGLARFGPTRAASAVLARSNKPALTLAMQLNLSPEGPHEVYGTIGQTSGTEVTERSIFTAARDFYNGRDRLLPAAYLVQDGRYTIRMANAADSGGLVRLSPGGSATLAIRLPDGTSVLASAPLSESNRAAFFWPLYTGRTGSFGGVLTADELLPESRADQPFWWCRPGQPWLDVALRSIP